jgi:large subunit ribosomal protein L9
MRVVLSRDVPNLGKAGDVREVADGYGRNFLIPRKLASPVTRASLSAAGERQEAEGLRHQRTDAELRELAQRLDGMTISIRAKVGMGGRLYGSVTNADIAEEVGRLLGEDLDRRKVELEKPIHQLGSYEVAIRLAEGIVPKLTVTIEEES